MRENESQLRDDFHTWWFENRNRLDIPEWKRHAYFEAFIAGSGVSQIYEGKPVSVNLRTQEILRDIHDLATSAGPRTPPVAYHCLDLIRDEISRFLTPER